MHSHYKRRQANESPLDVCLYVLYKYVCTYVSIFLMKMPNGLCLFMGIVVCCSGFLVRAAAYLASR